MNTYSSKTYEKKDVLEVQCYKISNSNDNSKFLASYAAYSIIKNLEEKKLTCKLLHIFLQRNFALFHIIWIWFATVTLYPTLGSCGACTPFSVPPQWNTGIEGTLSLPEGALQSLEIQAKGGDSDNGSSWWNLHPSYAKYPEMIPPSPLKSKTDTKIYDKCIRK